MKRLISLFIALLLLVGLVSLPVNIASAADGAQPADEPEVVSVAASEDAHFQMWSTQATYVYGNTRYLKVTRPGSDAGEADPTMGLFAELYTGGQVTTIDGSSSFLKFNLSEELRVKLAESNVLKAELVMKQFNRRYGNRGTTANLVVRRVTDNWNEANDHHIAGGDSDRSSYNYMKDSANGIFNPPTAETTVARSETFNILGSSGTNNWNSNNGSGKANAMTSNNLGTTNQDIVTDITSIVSGLANTDTTLSLAVNQEGSGEVLYFVSKEGGSEGGLSGADETMIPTLRLTLEPAAVDEDMAIIDLQRDIDGTVTARFTVARASASNDMNAIGIVALYDANGKLVSAQKQDTGALNIVAGAAPTAANITIPSVPNAYSVKAFLWNADTFVPLCAETSREKIEEVAFTATADGVTDVTTTTKIDLVFDKPVTGLTADAITLSPASAVKGELTGSGTNWSLAVSDVTAGEVTVSVVDFDNYLFSSATESADEVMLCVRIENVAFTATANGSDGITTTRINLVFDKSVTGLTAEAITLSPARAVKGALTGSGTTWALALSEVTAGEVTVSIAGYDNYAFAPASEGDDEVLFYYTAPLRDPVTGNEWNEIESVQVNQLDSRTMIVPFADAALAKANPTLKLAEENSDSVILLNGTWQFNWVAHHSVRTSAPVSAGKPDISGVTEIPETGYFDITVPSSWQTNMQYAGWKGRELDWPIYSNTNYPWGASGIGGSTNNPSTGQPAQVNPVGTYMRYVNIDEADLADNRFIISFLGVEAGFFLYVNGVAGRRLR